MKKTQRIVLIGTGGRANAYSRPLARLPHVKIVACADPHAEHCKTFLGLNNLFGKTRQFRDWREMLDKTPDIDGAIITNPNHLHTQPAIECMQRGYVVALEKPIAAGAADCRRLRAVYQKRRARVLIGFVMRSNPFYLQAREWIDQGRIGEVVSIQADELPEVITTSVMFRSDWRRFTKTSGGALLEKCCHDIDMLTWMARSRPVRMSSLAGIKAFKPNPSLPKRCGQCGIKKQCVYFLPPKEYNRPGMIRKTNDGILYRFVRDNSACIYNNGHDIYDHQTVQIEYANGAVASLMLDFACAGATAGRHLKIIGAAGVIYGKAEDNIISLQSKRNNRTETVRLKDDGSGHGGCDANHARTFVRMLEDKAFTPLAGFEAGYLSAMMCFAADQSAREKRQLDLLHLPWDKKIVRCPGGVQ